jgi:hypothetical protein
VIYVLFAGSALAEIRYGETAVGLDTMKRLLNRNVSALG